VPRGGRDAGVGWYDALVRAIEAPLGDAMTVEACELGRHLTTPRGGRFRALARLVVIVSLAAAVAVSAPRGRGQDAPPGATPDQEPPAAEDAGVFLPSDRGKERQLDRAARLIAAGDWTDAAAILDEILADDRDAFVAAAAGAGTRSSIRSEAMRLVGGLPPAGRDAYALLCRSRADRALAEAIRQADAAGVVAVARRWFATPAGRRAAVLAAQTALEADDPSTAAAWLGRLAVDGEPAWKSTINLMRAAAAARVGDRTAAERFLADVSRMPATGGRIAGAAAASSGDRPASAWLDRFAPRADRQPADEWLLARGDAARNAIVEATEPLLVPRYRVPLTRHPEEARLLEKRRRALVADGGLAVPAGLPLAVAGTVVMPTPLGILGVDFETGKRVWLQSAVAMARPAGVDGALGRGFDDATSGGLSSDGRRVFAVESHPDALTPAADAPLGAGLGVSDGRWAGGNSLTAYDATAKGAVVWRLPADEPAAAGGDGASRDWYMGAPLVVGRDLFVLVEAHGQVRLDVLDAADGRVQWSQPLADLEERQSAASPDGYARRLAGLTPALGEGVLVCPIGGGTVVALDLTSRALLWAHSYRRAAVRGEDAGGVRLRGLTGELREPSPVRGGDPWPVIAAGRVFLMPYDAEGLVCLGLRDGAPAWQQPVRGRHQMVGVIDGSLIFVGPESVDAVAIDTGRQRWTRPHPPGARPSGRGLLTGTRLFLPVDPAGVVEIAVADGRILGQHAVRGGSVPGNLIAVRGEVISRGIDFLEVFHQTAELESKVETALRDDRQRPWADSWRGQLDLTAGDVTAALPRLRSSAAAARMPPAAVADALAFALRRDFPRAVRMWQSWDDAGEAAAATPDVLRAVIDGCLERRDDVTAWRACRRLLAATDVAPHQPLIADPSQSGLEVDPDRWLCGRLADLASRADPAVRGQIDAVIDRTHPPAAGAADAGPAAADPAAVEWPLGRVAVSRPRRMKAEPGVAGSQVVAVPLVGAVDPVVPGITVSYDMQQRRLLVADGFGQRIVEPLPLEPSAALPWLNQMSPIEPSVVGRTLVVRTAAGVSGYDLGAAAGESRLLWKTAGRSTPGRDLVSVRAVAGGRVARNGGVPLGRRITEPDDLDGPRGTVAPPARRTGVLVPAGRTAALLEPTTGRVLWERQGLPGIAEWIADDDSACGCTADGLASPVLSMCDGRLLHVVDLPGRRQRLASHGRFVVAVVPGDDSPLAVRVRLDRIDPLRQESRPLGEFAGESRATMVGDGLLAVLEPDGLLTLIDVVAGAVAWRTRLEGTAARIDELHVMPWRDRYLVFAASADVAALDDAALAPLQGLLPASDATGPLSGAIWAVARDDGRPLWQTPATVRQHCLLVAQPPDLPVLVLTRQTRPGDGGRPELAVLCLDKRTGHAVLDEQRLPLQQHLFVGCDVSGAPQEHTISIRGFGAVAPTVTLAFTGQPVPPQPPYQAEGRPPAAGLGLDPLGRVDPAGDGR
jgi:outer membrane protein assembly factor BamB